MLSIIKSISTALALSLLVASGPSRADDDLFGSAAALYNAGRYGEAIVRFRVVVRLDPNSIAGHYYLGLCYQRVKSVDQAIEEFKWVLLHARDQRVCQMAGQALLSLDRKAVLPTAMAARTPRTWSSSYANTPAAAPVDPNKRLRKVIEIYQPNSGSALEFAPVFEDVKGKFTGIEFVAVDRTDPANAELVQKYKSDSEVTVVYLDVAGRVLKIYPGAPTRTFAQEMADLAVGRKDSYWSGATVAAVPINPKPTSTGSQRHLNPNKKPVRKVVEFFKPGSPFHLEFSPVFDEARSRFAGIQFVSLTKFDPLYGEVGRRYGLDGEVAVVYFDGSGNVLSVHNGIMNINQFCGEISSLVGEETL